MRRWTRGQGMSGKIVGVLFAIVVLLVFVGFIVALFAGLIELSRQGRKVNPGVTRYQYVTVPIEVTHEVTLPDTGGAAL